LQQQVTLQSFHHIFVDQNFSRHAVRLIAIDWQAKCLMMAAFYYAQSKQSQLKQLVLELRVL
jgi:acyl-coenzyme A synthetase/AMP-(fatty) acid ligase